MSRLIDIDLQVQPESETEGYEFSYYTFDSLSAFEVSNVRTSEDISLNDNNTDTPNKDLWRLPVSNNTLSKLQWKDMFCKNILNQIEKGNIVERQLNVVKDKPLRRYVIDGDNTYGTTVIPRTITTQIHLMAPDNLGT